MEDAREVYGDIIDMKHHVSERRAQMPRQHRAIQFAPFAALTGYDDLITEAARGTEMQAELDEAEKLELNEKLHFLLENPEAEGLFQVFQPDSKKLGGEYIQISGSADRFDAKSGELVLQDGTRITIEHIRSIEVDIIFDDLF
ncbi:MAG: hypothetical protein J6P31_03710 [Oscillospiraceae bacterium]|nr:hypothetical protein [Oscillospiraceae bacterium]